MKLYKAPRIMPRITVAKLTGFKRSDFMPVSPLPKRRKRRKSIKQMLKEI